MLLHADSIYFAYKEDRVLNGVYCQLHAGECLALLGRNGSGKSTFFKLLMGRLKAQQGIVKIGGSFVKPEKRYNYLSWLAQDSFLPASLRVAQLFRLFGKSQNPVIKVDEWPEIQNLWRSRIGSLSTGERRLLELAIILNQEQPLILLDEPFTGLQPSTILRLSASITEKLQRGHGIILCDHQYRPALQSGQRRALLHQGRLHELPQDSDPTVLLSGVYTPQL